MAVAYTFVWVFLAFDAGALFGYREFYGELFLKLQIFGQFE